MALAGNYLKNRLIRRLNALGPYLRETKCNDNYFFFDCLAVCLSAEALPEKREFWGWWMEIESDENNFIYSYQYGLYDKQGEWVPQAIKESETQQILEETLRDFHSVLSAVLDEMGIKLAAAPKCVSLDEK